MRFETAAPWASKGKNFDRIFVADKSYTVFLTDAREQTDLLLRKLIKAKTIPQIQEGAPQGEEYTINKLLERGQAGRATPAADRRRCGRYTPRRRGQGFPEPIFRNPEHGVPRPQGRDRAAHGRQLRDHAHDPRGSPAKAIFDPRLLDSKHQRVGGPGPSLFTGASSTRIFRFISKWVTNIPFWGWTGCTTYRPNGRKGFSYTGKTPPKNEWSEIKRKTTVPHWIIVGSTEWGEIFSIPDKSLSLEPAKAAPRRFLKPRESEQQDAGVLQLRVQRDTKSFSTTESIEGQLAWHQQAIEELQREHRESRGAEAGFRLPRIRIPPAVER